MGSSCFPMVNSTKENSRMTKSMGKVLFISLMALLSRGCGVRDFLSEKYDLLFLYLTVGLYLISLYDLLK